jgi:hypothetical protein
MPIQKVQLVKKRVSLHLIMFDSDLVLYKVVL